ncbi:MAG: helix-turn-helix domain-containing protein [Clostridioides sp.]|nr:helix-turn-helix domain-containing protein [Clostridioides sp.]
MQIGERLKQIRIEKGISQQEMAERLRLSRTAISGYELGRRDISERMMEDICDIFNVNYNWFANGEGDMFYEMSDKDILLADALGVLGDTEDEDLIDLVIAICNLDNQYIKLIVNLIQNVDEVSDAILTIKKLLP